MKKTDYRLVEMVENKEYKEKHIEPLIQISEISLDMKSCPNR